MKEVKVDKQKGITITSKNVHRIFSSAIKKLKKARAKMLDDYMKQL